MNQRLIAITGGIGCGKSVVSNILRALEYPVYDCDSEAKRLMNDSNYIKSEISKKISCEAIALDGSINRPVLAKIVFNDNKLLSQLNTIVHSAVKEDIINWTKQHQTQHTLFVETAILYQSGINLFVDEVWEIQAPIDLRINRVILRNNTTAEDVQSRINSQQHNIEKLHDNTKYIVNDNIKPILPQILNLIKEL
ncbi:MAG: dephospho-CoA kinase [Muribaculaceae bacterium]|nr:dephospho-CoA kinase [Muribaculaceae bacterium]